MTSLAFALPLACRSAEHSVPISDAGPSHVDTGTVPPDAGPSPLDAPDDAPACGRENVGPRHTWDPPLETMDWELVEPEGDGGLPMLGTEPVSGCGVKGAFPRSVACQGFATTASSASGLALSFEDGSQLRWVPAAGSVAPAPLFEGQRVWVDYSHEVGDVCGFCGSYRNDELTIRADRDEPILFFAREGHRLEDVGEAFIRDLFGVGFERRRIDCEWTFSAGCQEVTRVAYDHVLQTAEPMVVPHATRTRVTTPTGEFEVLWAATEETPGKRQDRCADGPGIASATGFSVTRLEPEAPACARANWGIDGATVVPLDVLCSETNGPCLVNPHQSSSSLSEVEAHLSCTESGDAGAPFEDAGLPDPDRRPWTRTEGCGRVVYESKVWLPVQRFVYDAATGDLIGAARMDDIGVELLGCPCPDDGSGWHPCENASYVAGEWNVDCDDATVSHCLTDFS